MATCHLKRGPEDDREQVNVLYGPKWTPIAPARYSYLGTSLRLRIKQSFNSTYIWYTIENVTLIISIVLLSC